MRTTRAIAIVSVAVLVGTLLGAAPALAQDRTVTVTPFAAVDGGQLVQVSGTGWTPNVDVGFCQAANGQVGEPITQELCGRPTGVVTTDSQGDFVGELWLDRFLYIPLRDAWVDCTDPADGGCGIGAAEISDLVGTATVPDPQIEFAAPPDPPATQGTISYTPAVGVRPGGEVTVTGSGFRADAVIDLYQCLPAANDPSMCDPGPQSSQRVVADAAGAFVAGFVVDQFVLPPTSPSAVDCTTTACTITASEAVDFPGTVAEAGLVFPTVVIPGAASVTEGDAGTVPLEIPVSLLTASDDVVTVQWETVFLDLGSAIEADPTSDYGADGGLVTFPIGETDAMVTIDVNGDVLFEPGEIFIVRFYNPTNAAIGGFFGLGLGGIINDEASPLIVPGTIEVPEGDGGSVVVDVPVSMVSASVDPVTVEWNTVELEGTPLPADEGVDYDFGSGSLTFPAGTTEATVPVTINGDTDAETDELVVVSFHDPVGAPLGGFFGLGFVAILDDDEPGLVP
jgi:hypothetical protein